MSLCRCPLDPLLEPPVCDDEHRDQWSSLVLRDLLVSSTSELGLDAKLGDPSDHWHCFGVRHDPAPSRSGKRCWQEPEPKTGGTTPATDLMRMRSNAGTLTAQEFQWHSPSTRAPVPSAVKSSRRDQKAVATHRMRAHGHRKQVSNYIASDCLQCPGYNKLFPSRSKLLDQCTVPKQRVPRQDLVVAVMTKLPSHLVRRTHIYAECA